MKFKIERYDDKTRLKLIHYDNLRQYYNKLIKEIMGEDYYTVNPEVTSSDAEAFEDMMYRIGYLKRTIKYKNVQLCLQFVLCVVIIYYISR